MIRIPRKPKYGNKKRNGFDSNKEAERWQQLCFLQKAGKITDLKRQVKFELIPAQYQDGICVERAVSYWADLHEALYFDVITKEDKSDIESIIDRAINRAEQGAGI